MIDKVRTLEAAIDTVHSGDTIMVGGFTISGCPLGLLKELSRRRINNLTTISEDIGYANTASFPAEAIKELFTERHIRKVYASFIGANPFVNELIQKGELEYELIPQGTLAERIRAGGSGIAGFYTPTGIGTIAERGKEKKVIDGKEYLLELPLRADVALIKAYRAGETHR